MNDLSFPTFRALEDYKSQQLQLLIWMFEHLSHEVMSKSMIETFGEEGFYDQISFHQKMIIAACDFNSKTLLYDYLRWRYTMCMSRGINPNYFLLEYKFWIQGIQTHLFEGFALEFVFLYRSVISHHDALIHDHHVALSDETLSDETVDRLVNTLLEPDESETSKIFAEKLYAFGSPNDFFDRIVKPAMIEIGRLWESNRISVAKEHVATAMIEHLWNRFSEVSDNASAYRTAFVITPDAQLHKLGSKMVAKVLSKRGWRVAHFGLEENFKELYNGIVEFNPQLIVLSATMAIYIPLFQQLINALKSEECIYEGKIAVGGQAFYRTIPPIVLKKADFQGETLSEFEQFLDTFG